MIYRSVRLLLISLLIASIIIWADFSSVIDAAPSLVAISTVARSAQELDQQGRSQFQAGQFIEAAATFQAAAIAYQTQGDLVRQAISLSNLALSQQQLGAAQNAIQSITTSLEVLQKQEFTSEQRSALAQTLDIQGSIYLAQGNPQRALESWEQATNLHQMLGNAERVAEGRINQAQAFQSLGRYRRAIALLTTSLKLNPTSLDLDSARDLDFHLSTLPNQPATIAALQSLGEALRVTGNLKVAEQLLKKSINLAEQSQQQDAIAKGNLRLGNIIWTQSISFLTLNNLTIDQAVTLINQNQKGQRFRNTDLALNFSRQVQKALKYYQDAVTNAVNSNIKIQAQLNQLSLLADTQNWDLFESYYQQISQQIDGLPINSKLINAKIKLAQQWIQFNSYQKIATNSVSVAQSLANTIQQARTLNDSRSQSFGLGTLGRLYEQAGQTSAALEMTRQALVIAQSHQAADIAYLWQWQIGRLLKVQGNLSAAIASYQSAVTTLQSVRKELAAVALNEQFAFRDTIEPIHRELVSLLLDAQTISPQPENLIAVRAAIESLQLTELVNFFREDCVIARPEQIDQADPNAAILYPIVLLDRVAVIASLPGQPLTYYGTAGTAGVTRTRLESIVNQLQRSLRQGNIPESDFLPAAEQLYDWLIRPIQSELITKQIKTLVFVPDGVLRNIPMSVLYDRQQNQYLIEQYSIALTPGLQLLGSRPLDQTPLKTFAAGLTQARSGFAALPNVKKELQQIATQVQDSQVFLNDRFTAQNLEIKLKTVPFPVVHLATHGQFSSQLENTFILTWDGRLTINDLQNILQVSSIRAKDPLELLVLSACETATGDNRAALGLAGMAVRAGARSTIATLWQVNDTSSAVAMGQLYRELGRGKITKAEALRRTQLTLLKSAQTTNYHHPYYWAGYVLVGNWQ